MLKMNNSGEIYMQQQQLSVSAKLNLAKDMCNNKLEDVRLFNDCPYQWFHQRGQGALLMVSLKDANEGTGNM